MGQTKTLCVDFDGVIHAYTSGWHDNKIADGPVPGALDWLRAMVAAQDIHVCIYSSRSRSDEGVGMMKDWLLDHGLEPRVLEQIEFPTQKPPAWLTIDDRCFLFKGTFPSIGAIRSFKPWNKP